MSASPIHSARTPAPDAGAVLLPDPERARRTSRTRRQAGLAALSLAALTGLPVQAAVPLRITGHLVDAAADAGNWHLEQRERWRRLYAAGQRALSEHGFKPADDDHPA